MLALLPADRRGRPLRPPAATSGSSRSSSCSGRASTASGSLIVGAGPDRARDGAARRGVRRDAPLRRARRRPPRRCSRGGRRQPPRAAHRRDAPPDRRRRARGDAADGRAREHRARTDRRRARARRRAPRRASIAGAALDVFEREPEVEEGLLELENVVLTPHLGSATRGHAGRDGDALRRGAPGRARSRARPANAVVQRPRAVTGYGSASMWGELRRVLVRRPLPRTPRLGGVRLARAPDVAAAQAEHEAFCLLLEEAGAEVVVSEHDDRATPTRSTRTTRPSSARGRRAAAPRQGGPARARADSRGVRAGGRPGRRARRAAGDRRGRRHGLARRARRCSSGSATARTRRRSTRCARCSPAST